MLKSKGEKIFQGVNAVILILIAMLTIYPMWEVVKISITHSSEVNKMAFSLWPDMPSLDGYREVLKNTIIWVGYRNTLVRIIIGMTIQMLITIGIAYPLSREYFPNKKFWTIFVVFTMFFNGGLIPRYLLIQKMHMMNSIWSLVLPRAIDTFAMIIMRNYFMTLPKSLEEAAKIDGASEITTLFRIILPLSKPILFTILLWGTVWHWNQWFDCLLYIRDSNKYVLQAILRKIIIDAAPEFSEMSMDITNTNQTVSQEVVKCATIIVSSLPIMLVYPFIQKYFISGIVVGAVKG